MDWHHVLERSWLHLGWAPWVIMGSVWGFWVLGRKRPKWRLTGPWRWIVPGVVALLFIFLREPGDVAGGGPLAKSYIDFAVWAAALFAAGLSLRWFVNHYGD